MVKILNPLSLLDIQVFKKKKKSRTKAKIELCFCVCEFVGNIIDVQ